MILCLGLFRGMFARRLEDGCLEGVLWDRAGVSPMPGRVRWGGGMGRPLKTTQIYIRQLTHILTRSYCGGTVEDVSPVYARTPARSDPAFGRVDRVLDGAIELWEGGDRVCDRVGRGDRDFDRVRGGRDRVLHLIKVGGGHSRSSSRSSSKLCGFKLDRELDRECSARVQIK